MQKRVSQLLIVVLLSALLASCGFHLRGNIPLSEGLKVMYLNAPEGSFKDELSRVLTKAGATITESKAGADVVLRVTKVDTDRTVGTLDDTGKANSYNLRLRVRYVLKDLNGKNIRKPSTIRESRRYNFDPEFVIESESEEAELLEDMEQDIALRIVRKLSTITDYQPEN